ncbi:MAG TPA: CDP-alcohol phosphatidyltransferase family protein [Acidobacteriota bacterium]|nr:CDP-alcohol phosphatidyltransferase family protein [Acidobacteriota bacterium]
MKSTVAGLTLFKRHLLTWKRVEADRIQIAAGEAADEISRLARKISIEGLKVEVAAEFEPEPHGEIVIDQRGDTLLDPKMVRRLTRQVRLLLEGSKGQCPKSLSLIDDRPAHYPPDEKSPYQVGVADDHDLQYVAGEQGDKKGEAHRLGLEVHLPDGQASPRRVSIGRHYWHRISSAQDTRPAQRKVLLATMKATDGIYARTNRRVSLLISRLLLPTPVTPNMVTVGTFFGSLAAGVLYAFGTYPAMLAGGFLAWFSSMLDGVDGELARAKFQQSDFGCWLEMVCDYLFYVFLFTGMGIGLYRSTGDIWWLGIGVESVAAVVLAFWVVALQRRRYGEEGEDVGEYGTAFQKRVEAEQDRSPMAFLARKLTFLATRAAMPYYIFFFTLLGLVKVLMGLVFLGTNVALVLAASVTRLFGRRTPKASRASDQPAP